MKSAPDLLATLSAELERPRNVSAQVANHLIETYDVTRETIGAFLENELPKLEDYEIDLSLSPLFTPSLHEQAVFAQLLARNSIPSGDWPALIRQLTARPTRAELVTDDGASHSVPLRDVTIERFVNRLRLDGSISETLFDLIEKLASQTDRPSLKAIARRAVWQNESRRAILEKFLTSALSGDGFRADDAVQLLRLVEIYEPNDTADLLARIPHWKEILRQEINDASAPKPFFNERVQELHGGGRDQRRHDNSRIAAKENEREFLERLEGLLS